MKQIFLLLTTFLCLTSTAQEGLKDVLGQHFLIGATMNQWQLSKKDSAAFSVIDRHFNAVVAENVMKMDALQPSNGVFDFRHADELLEFAQKHHQTLIGHCLVWHSQVPSWMFIDKEGQTVSREVLIERMRSHIATVVGHYKGKVHGWDVVNEAIADDGTMRRSPYYNIIGEEFIEIAFRAAHEADPQAELYYNDYSMANPLKRKAACQLVKRLKDKGIRIDAVGMQSHVGLNYPDLSDYEATIDSLAACGVKVMITELDINVLPNPNAFGGAAVEQNYEYQQRWNPYVKGLPTSKQQELEQRWLALFDIYKRHAQQITRVNLWGIGDHNSWLNNWPIKGRTNYPLLFDREYKEKPVIKKIMNLYK
jgi:endo-1,4-beta-xylanase